MILHDPDMLLIFTTFVPIFVDMILNNIISTVHSYFVADLGDSVISGVGLAGQLANIFIMLFTGMCSAVAVVISQYNGAKNYDGAKKCISQTLFAVTVISTIIGVVFFVFTKELFGVFYAGTEQSVLEPAVEYLKYYAISLPFYGLFQCFANASRGMGNNKIPLKISVSGSAINLIIAFICIKVFHLGVFGAGLGVIISRIYMTVVGFVIFARQKWLSGVKDTLMLDMKLIGSVLSLGFMTSSESFIVNIGATVKMNFLLEYGSAHMAARSIDATFSALLVVPVTVFSVVAVTLVGRYIGADAPDEARNILNKIVKCAYALYGTLMLVGLAVLPFLFKGYTDSELTYSLLIKLMFVNFIMSVPVSPGLNCMLSGFKAAGDAKFSMIVSMICMWTVNVGAGYILTDVMGLGVIGFVISAYLSAWAKFVIILFRYRSGKWIHKKMVV